MTSVRLQQFCESKTARFTAAATHKLIVSSLVLTFSFVFQYDGSLEVLVRESEQLRRTYGHYFDLNIVNNDIDDTLAQLEAALARLRSTPQWVPVSWVY